MSTENIYRHAANPIALFLGIVLLIFLIPGLYSIPVEQVLFQPEAYNRAVALQEPDERMVDLLYLWVTNPSIQLGDGGIAAQLNAIEATQLRDLLRQSLPAGWAQGQAESVIEDMLRYFNFETTELSILINFSPLANSITAHSQELADAIVGSWPPCTPELLLDFGARALTGDVSGIPFCYPGETLAPVAEGVVATSLQFFAGTLPQFIDLADLLHWPAEPGWWPIYRLMRMLISVAPVISLFLALMIVLFSYGRIFTGLAIIGRSLIFAGAVVIAIQIFSILLLGPVTRAISASTGAFLPQGLIQFLIDGVRLVQLRFTFSVAVWAFAALVWGIALAFLPEIFLSRIHANENY